MSKVSLRQIKDYFLLLIITGSAVTLSVVYAGNKDYLRKVVLGFAAIYILWGLFHHKNEKTINRSITLEYLLISALGASLVIGLI